MTSTPSLPDLRTAERLAERVDSTRIVFRVFDSSTFRGYDPTSGFEATGFNERTHFHEKRLAEAHINWNNKTIVTPWISTSRRWLWAIWEANRRSEGYRSDNSFMGKRFNVRIAVIDLNACRGTSKPPVHALSVLDPGTRNNQFPNHSDEILIYGKVPPEAVLSVWRFEKPFRTMALPPSIALHLPTGHYMSFYDFYQSLVTALINPRGWDPREEGERCVNIVTCILQDGYIRLEANVDSMIGPVRDDLQAWVHRNSNTDDPMGNLINEMSLLSADRMKCKVLTQGNNVGAPPPSHPMTLKKGGKGFQKTMMRWTRRWKRGDECMRLHAEGIQAPVTEALSQPEKPELVWTIRPADARLVRLARAKIEKFRSVALEFARIVPLGLIDQQNIDRNNWTTARLSMIGGIDAWLAPLERKLKGLEDTAVPAQILLAKRRWLGNEQGYPRWWEYWGTQLTMGGTDPSPVKRSYTYLVD